jgi:hypothetical protein
MWCQDNRAEVRFTGSTELRGSRAVEVTVPPYGVLATRVSFVEAVVAADRALERITRVD